MLLSLWFVTIDINHTTTALWLVTIEINHTATAIFLLLGQESTVEFLFFIFIIAVAQLDPTRHYNCGTEHLSTVYRALVQFITETGAENTSAMAICSNKKKTEAAKRDLIKEPHKAVNIASSQSSNQKQKQNESVKNTFSSIDQNLIPSEYHQIYRNIIACKKNPIHRKATPPKASKHTNSKKTKTGAKT